LKRQAVAHFLAPAVAALLLSAMSACESGLEKRLSAPEPSRRTPGMAPASTTAVPEGDRGSVKNSPIPDRGVDEASGGGQDELVGDFCFPRNVPDYEVISAQEGGNELMTISELLVDAEATSEVDLTLIARHLKVSYFYLDALLVSFVDRSKPGESETGEAQIINTVSGALILGMSDGPPNKEGLTVISYGDPASIDQDEVFARTACS
jgi:hypothetical protein